MIADPIANEAWEKYKETQGYRNLLWTVERSVLAAFMPRSKAEEIIQTAWLNGWNSFGTEQYTRMLTEINKIV